MNLNEVELKKLADFHKSAQELIFALGQMDLRMDDTRAQIRAINGKAQAVMNEVAQRLGIAPGTPWQALPDGRVVTLDPATNQAPPNS